jgi:hypothetical protein
LTASTIHFTIVGGEHDDFWSNAERRTAMITTTGRASPRDFQVELEKLARTIEGGPQPACALAMRSFLTALKYEDPTLIRAAINEAASTLANAAAAEIVRQHAVAERVKRDVRGAMDQIVDSPANDFDGLGRTLEFVFDRVLTTLKALRDEWVQVLLDSDCDVANVDTLDADISELQTMKQQVLGDWPWSDEPLPPVDWGMVARSRAIIANGGGEPIEDLIRRLENNDLHICM